MIRQFRLWLILVPLVFLSGCHVARYFYWNVANIDDYRKFQNARIPAPKTASRLPVKTEPWKVPPAYADNNSQNLTTFLSKHKTVAFLIVRDDTVRYESYFEDYNQRSRVTSFSVAKTFVSALTGIAIDEGYITSVNDPVAKYLPYIDTTKFSSLTIRHLLNMRSGIKANEGYYNPFGDVAKYYYGRNLDKYLRNLQKKEAPGKTYEYLSVNTQLLADVLEHATGLSMQQYLEQKIWKPLGMEADALWSMDSRKHQTVKAFCCLNAYARDFARFGMLYLHQGQWLGKQVVPREWVATSHTVMNNSSDSQGYSYTYKWRVTEYGAFFAKGIRGQYIYIWPEKNSVAVRFGASYDDIDWARFMKQVILSNEPE